MKNHHNGTSTEDRRRGGCDFRLKKDRIYVQLQLQSNPWSRRVVNTGRWISEISAWQKIFWLVFVMVSSAWRRRGPYVWHTVANSHVKTQNCENTCEGVSGTKECNENTMPPSLPGVFESSRPSGRKDWLIGVFIDTQTFSVPTRSHKALISGWGRSAYCSR